MEGKGPRARELFEAFVAAVRSCGQVEFAPAKSGVGFIVRVRFAGVKRVSERGMTCGFWLKRKISSPRFTNVESIPPSNWIYTLRITDPTELDDEVPF